MQNSQKFKSGVLLSLFEERMLLSAPIKNFKYVRKVSINRYTTPQTIKQLKTSTRRILDKMKIAFLFWFYPKASPTINPDNILNYWKYQLLNRLSRSLNTLKGISNFSFLRYFKNLEDLDIDLKAKAAKFPFSMNKLKHLDINNFQISAQERRISNIHRLKKLEHLKLQGTYTELKRILTRWENSKNQTKASLNLVCSRFDSITMVDELPSVNFPFSKQINYFSANNQNNFCLFPSITEQFSTMKHLKTLRYIDIYKSSNNFLYPRSKLENLRQLQQLKNLALNLGFETKDLKTIAGLDDLYFPESLERLELILELPDSAVGIENKDFDRQLGKLVNLKEFEFVTRSPGSLRDSTISEGLLNLLLHSTSQLPSKQFLKRLRLRIQGVNFSPREAYNEVSIEKIMGVLSDFSALESFTLHSNSVIHRNEAMALVMPSAWTKLKSLNLCFNHIDEDAFSVMLACPQLESLSVDVHAVVSREDFIYYARLITQKLRALRYLEVMFADVNGVNIENYKEVSHSIVEIFRTFSSLNACFLCLSDIVLPHTSAEDVGQVVQWKKALGTCVVQTRFWSLFKSHLQNGSYTVKAAQQTVL